MPPAELQGGACDAGGRGNQTPVPCLPGRFLSLQVIIPTEHKACHRCPRSAVSVMGGTNPPPPGVSVWPHGSDTPSQAGAAQQGHQPHSASLLSRLYPLLTLPQCLLSPPRVPSPCTCTGPHGQGGRMLGGCRPPSPAGPGPSRHSRQQRPPCPGTVLWGTPCTGGFTLGSVCATGQASP